MPQALSTVPENLKDLPELLTRTEGFPAVLSALHQRRSATVDGAWGSSAALAAAALAQHTPRTLLVVIAHPRDIDGWTGDLGSFTGLSPILFPAWDDFREQNESGGSPVDEVAGQRLRLLKHLESPNPPRLVLTTLQALIQPVPDRAQLAATRRRLSAGQTIDLEELASWLVEHGYRPTEAVELPGEFSRRGGILDVFSPDAESPHRVEFFGDDIESIRQFSPQTQRSLGNLLDVEIMAVQAPSASEGNRGHFCDYLPEDAWTVLVEVEELHEQGRHYLERVAEETGLFSVAGVFQQLLRFPSVTISALPSPSVEASCHLHVESVERFSGEVGRVRDELDAVATHDIVLIACHNEGECKRLGEVLATGQLAQSERLHLVTGRVRAGFRFLSMQNAECRMQNERQGSPHSAFCTLHSALSLIVLGGQELFHREEVRQVQPRRRLESRAIDSFLDLTEGDLVVHVSHGIARYRGMELLEKNANRERQRGESKSRHAEEHLILEFAGGVRVYVPASKIDLVQKYVGGARTDPELSKFGGTSWQNRKARVQTAVMDLASDMIQMQALREAEPGVAAPPDSEWQAEFEASFPYQETPDQLTSMAEIKGDMQRARPMDRLICGDVGYGKTELAIRAAFKTIDNGRQVAVLVPTTVLAEQHYRTFSQRLAEYPFTVECLSRFRSSGEQKRIVERLKKGGVDIVIGTHRLVSADVHFKDLGLVIIDEEQRFGVEHKERLKHLRQKVDVLTMTATPIPRTLHLSLLGIRDISNLETPPPDRLAIETRIVRFDAQLIRHAVLREMNRDGQVYFVHNRVQNIHEIAERLRKIVPDAKVTIVHGQMAADELEEEMLRFVRREADILVATTIIESGLDIPNANTIFINQADHYGLADLHQLRGRVGRYKHRAYAYMLLDSERTVTPNAARRLKAIEEFTELGAGFKIALRDLEIRGAGNILGNQQSGHIAAVGYEMYCQLLENAVRTFKKQPLRTPLEVNLDLPWTAFLPRDYVQGQRLRIEVYRRLSRVRRLERLADFRQELRDRFGALPESAEWLLRLAELRLLAAHWKIASIHLEKPIEGGSGPTDVVLGYRNPRRIRALADRSAGRLRIVDDASAYFRPTGEELEPLVLYTTLKRLLSM
ncbi:MAG TPA: transcription-repair coupling factor [Gemmataceae bacterium]|nr:transcription-repair coupling factor [Gemmataceae bacterium]